MVVLSEKAQRASALTTNDDKIQSFPRIIVSFQADAVAVVDGRGHIPVFPGSDSANNLGMKLPVIRK
jgi:hypothetical protein